MQNQVAMIQQWLIVTHLVDQARCDKYHRLESLSQRGEAEADGHFSFSRLIVAIKAAFFHVNGICSSIRASSVCLRDYYINCIKDFTRQFQGANLQFQTNIFLGY